MVLAFAVLTVFLTCSCQTKALDYRDQLSDFHEVQVHHVNQQTRNKRSTKDVHFNETKFTVFLKDRKITLHLQKNSILISDKFKHVYQNEDGSRTIEANRGEDCFYHGKIEGQQRSRVMVSTCNGLRGLIVDEDNERLFIEPLHNQSTTHIMFNMKDLKTNEKKSCGHSHDITVDDLLELKESENHDHNRIFRSRRSTSQWKYIEVVVVVDKRKHTQWGGSVEDSKNKAVEIMNYVDAVYKTLRTRITVIGVIVWNVNDESEVTSSASRTLHGFSSYTAKVIHGDLDIYNDNAQLISGIDFEGSVVGLAGIGVICGLSSSAVNQDHSSNPAVSANTVAHELGHNLGFFHNTGSCTCSNPPCVMSATSPHSPVQGFSSCAKDKFNSKINGGQYPCMSDYPQEIFGPSRCGDGYKEDDEECDCGTEQDCIESGADKCCNFATCMLQQDAKCADGECCDNCKFKSKGVLCRDRMHNECDLEEFCIGNSSHCPRNFYIADGKPCSNAEGYCFQGLCKTHTQQCEVLWGPNGYIAEDPCFNLNLRGDEYGHCGKEEDLYKSCPEENRLCGKIQCQGKPGTALPTWPLLGSNRGIKTTTFSSGGSSFRCKAVKMSFPSELEDPTMTFDGTKCADNSVCLSNTCTNLSSLQNIKTCDQKCHNGGVCNNNGQCHCPYGYACPDCIQSGIGGSLDSGQGCSVAQFTQDDDDLSLLVLLLIPICIGAAVFILYRFKRRVFNKVFPFLMKTDEGATSTPVDEGIVIEEMDKQCPKEVLGADP